MKLLAVGGGSGGHVTPVRAVIAALAATDPKLDVVFVCDTRFAPQSRELMSHAPVPVRIVTIAAGKWRRYHGQSWATRLRDVRTNAANLRDIFLIAVGALQSLWLLYRERPDVVFAKGGFVCVPVGWAAHVLRIPLVIHDSDTKPGLTNRWLSRWADAIATGASLDNYPYSREISHFVGIPIDSAFHPFGEEEQKAAKDALGISDITKPLLVVTGGGLGAKAINDAVMGMVPELAQAGVAVYHIVGKAHYDFMYQHAPKAVDYVIVPFVGSGMDKVLGAGDVVITRASATALQELAALRKPTVIIPAPQLGDQVKNATMYREANAAVVLDEARIQEVPALLEQAVKKLLTEPKVAKGYATRLGAFAKPDAAADVASLVVSAAVRKQGAAKAVRSRKVRS